MEILVSRNGSLMKKGGGIAFPECQELILETSYYIHNSPVRQQSLSSLERRMAGSQRLKMCSVTHSITRKVTELDFVSD